MIAYTTTGPFGGAQAGFGARARSARHARGWKALRAVQATSEMLTGSSQACYNGRKVAFVAGARKERGMDLGWGSAAVRDGKKNHEQSDWR